LSAGKIAAILGDNSLISVWESLNKGMNARGPCGLLDACQWEAWIIKGQIGPDGIVEEEAFLQYHPYAVPERWEIQILQIMAIKMDGTLGRNEQPHH
jgi:hypothetical protein